MTNLALRQSCLAVACIFILNLSNLPVAEGQLPDDKRSHVVFDVQLDKLRTWAESQGLDIDEMIVEMSEGQLPTEIASSLSRVFGSIQLPTDMETAMAVGQSVGMGPGNEMRARDASEGNQKESSEKESYDGDLDDFDNVSFRREARQEENVLPINFFIRIRFNDAAGAAAFSQATFSRGVEKVINGKSYMAQPPGDRGPSNIVAHLVDETTVEFGTVDYVTQANRKFFTPNLSQAWGRMSDEAIRLAVDLDGISDLLDQVVMMARENAPPGMGGMIDLVTKVSALQLSLDVQSENLVSLVLTGKDETQAEELRSGLDGLLAMGKMFGGQATEEIGRVSPESGAVADEILQSLKATRDAKQVSILIPRPAGFDDAVQATVAKMKTEAIAMEEMHGYRQAALAVHNYHDAYKGFPFVANNEMSEDLSWRARISPFMDGPSLDPSKAFDDPANSEFADQMPSSFGTDGSNSIVSWIQTEDAPKTFYEVTDGTSNTIMLLQNTNGTPWMQPGDLTVDQAVELITGLQEGESLIAAFYDGACRRLRAGMSADDIRPFLTPRGGELPNYDVLDDN